MEMSIDDSPQAQLNKRRLADVREQLKGKENSVRYAERKEVEDYLLGIFRDIGDAILESAESRKFRVDEDNELLIRFLIAYQCRWETRFTELSRTLTGKNGDLYAPLLLMGDKGVGKTLLMQIASRFAYVAHLNSREFINTSSSELLNAFRVGGNIDYYTYNLGKRMMREGAPHTARPFGVCLHDLGTERDDENRQKVFGTDMEAVVNDFLMARYELYQNNGLMFHITTNLDMPTIIKVYPPRVADRFKPHNQIYLKGKSRRGL